MTSATARVASTRIPTTVYAAHRGGHGGRVEGRSGHSGAHAESGQAGSHVDELGGSNHVGLAGHGNQAGSGVEHPVGGGAHVGGRRRGRGRGGGAQGGGSTGGSAGANGTGTVIGSCSGSTPPLGTKLNPNRIGVQSISMDVRLAPNLVATPMGGANVGLALNGVTVFGNMAAPEDDICLESATFDRCQGHPQNSSAYHHHSEPHSISYDDSNFIGVLKDGYPLYGRRDQDGSLPALDADGGHTGVTPDSAGAAVYHYHVNLQTSTAATSLGKQEWFLMRGTSRGTPGN